MKKKQKSDFFSHAKKVMGDKRYNKAITKGRVMAYELRLQYARELLGLNQTDLKGLEQPEVSKIESRKDLKLSTLSKYAHALGMNLKITLVSPDDETHSISVLG